MKKNQTPARGAKYAAAHRRRKKWTTTVTVMAAVVVFCVTYALILPAITMESDYICGMTEHTHGEECYDRALICTLEEGTVPGHTHDDACYEKVRELVCGLEESDETGHVHDESCYETKLVNVCGLPECEDSEHVHDESCYEYKLICEIPEHTHSDECLPVDENESSEGSMTGENPGEGDETGEGKIDEEPGTEPGDETEPGESAVLTASGEDWSFAVSYTAEAMLPEDVTLAVRELLPETEEFDSYAVRAAEAMGEEPHQVSRRFFDVSLLSGEEKVEPAAPVRVSVSFAGMATDGAPVVHFPDAPEADLMTADPAPEVEVLTATVDEDGLHYEQGSFSVVGIMAASVDDSTLELRQYLGTVDGLNGTGPYAIYNKTRNKVMLTSTVGTGNETKGLGTGDLTVENCIWNFAKSGSMYKIYYLNNGTRQYLKLADSGESNGNYALSLTNAEGDATNFTIGTNDNHQFVLCRGSGPYIDAYNTNKFAGWEGGTNQNGFNSQNETMTLYYAAEPQTVQTISPTSTVIDLFDYRVTNAALNNKWKEEPNTANEGINVGHFLRFGVTGLGNEGNVNKWTNKQSSGATKGVLQGIVANNLNDKGYPYLAGGGSNIGIFSTSNYGNLGYELGPTDESLEYLFSLEDLSDSSGNLFKKAYGNVKGLLQLSSDGYYKYDSRDNYAEFVLDSTGKSGRFNVYDDWAVYSSGDSDNVNKQGQFFPFDSYASVSKTTGDDSAELNHIFGMTLTTYFVQNYNGYADNEHTIPTTFEFSGDDDVWIFIDDILVADLGGIHERADVKIDFVTGTVTIDMVYNSRANVTTYFKDIFSDADLATYTDKSGTEHQTLTNNSSHTLKFFYLERGAGSSNLMLKYNLLEIPATSIYKIDQYGDPLAGAQFAVYGATKQADGTYLYNTDQTNADGSAVTQSLAGHSFWDGVEPAPTTSYWKYRGTNNGGDQWDIIVKTIAEDGSSTETTIPCKYCGATDGNGEMIFQSGDGSLLSLDDMIDTFGSEYFILREVHVPDGYRTVSDESWFHIDPDAGVMLCESTYTSGVWASNNAWVTAESALDVATEYNNVAATLGLTPTTVDGNTTYTIPYVTTDNGTTTSYGTLFGVVLKRNGRNFDRGYGYNFWYPVYGSDSAGYWVVGDDAGEPTVPTEPTTEEDWNKINFTNCPVNVEAAIEAAKQQAIISGGDDAVIFTPVASGSTATYKLLMENLPGKIDRYFTYMLNKTLAEKGNYSDAVQAVKDADTASGGADPQYTIAYYWTSGTLEGATAENTVRVYSHDGLTTGNFAVEWGTTIEVPNMENRLFFQKRDQAKSTSMTNGLLNGAVFALYPATDAPMKVEGVTSDTHLNYYIGSDNATAGQGNTVYIIPYTDGSGVAVFGYDNGTLKLFGKGSYEIYTENLTFDQTNGLVTSSTGTAGLITVTLTGPVAGVGTQGATYYIHPVTNAANEIMVGVTHSTCDYATEAGTGHFTKLPTGTYLMREIYAPSGYEVNTTDIPVLVNEIGVYANAGSDHDGVSVGNGIGFLSKTIDVFASLNEIDESLAWVYGALLRSDATGFTAFDDVTHDVIQVAGTDWQFVKQVEGDPTGYGSDKTDYRTEAMVTYYEYRGTLTDSEIGQQKPLYDYIPNDDLSTGTDSLSGQDARPAAGSAPATLKGQGTYRLWTMEGWSDLAIYQDYAYGHGLNPTTTYYEDLTDQGNLSNLFSSSTFVQVTDTPSAVDLTVKKVAANEDGTVKNSEEVLSGAQFRIKQVEYDTDGNVTGTAYYRYDKEADSTVWEPVEASATIVTTDASGLASFYDLAPREDAKYFLEEIKAPEKYVVSVKEIAFTVKTVTSGTGDDETHTPTLALAGTYEGVTLTQGTNASDGTPVYTLTVPNKPDPNTYVAQINLDISKVAQDGTTPLAGAEFMMYRTTTDANNLTTKWYYTSTNGTTTWENGEGTTLTSDANGKISTFFDLDDIHNTETDTGVTTYFLVETRAPDGYNLLTDPIKIDVDIEDGTNADPVVKITFTIGETVIYTAGGTDNLNTSYQVVATDPIKGEPDETTNIGIVTYLYTLTVPNSNGYELPSTGGVGREPFAAAGLLLMAIAVVYVYGQRRRRERRAE